MGDIPNSSSPLLTPKLADHKPPTLDARTEQCIAHFGWPQLIQAILVSLSWAFDAQQCFISIFTDSLSYPSNILTEWSLQTATPILSGLPASSFFIGCVTGGPLLTPLADSILGRKKLLILSCLLMSLAGISISFATNIYIYSALRFLSGFGRASIGTCSLVLSSELVGQRWRSHIGIMGFVLFAFGFASLPAIAYINQNSSWRNIYLWTSLPALLYTITIHFCLKESPRWLIIRNLATAEESNRLNSSDIYSAMKTLVSRKWSCHRLIFIMIITFGLGIVYYGMPLGLGNLSFNLYISVTMNAFLELPASLVTFILIGTMNRKTSLLVTATLSGVCSIACGAVTGSSPMLKTVQVVLEMVSFLSGTTALDVALIYTTELFPTCVRNSALSMVRQALVFGGAFAPVLAAAGRQNEFVTYGVFGLVVLACGVVVVWLPETKGAELCDTMEQEECKQNVGLVV